MKKPATPRYNDSPLRTFDSVEKNLLRERRVFSIVVLLLVLVTFAGAGAIFLVRLSDSLRAQEQLARIYEQGIVDAVLERRSALMAANLILDLRANDAWHADHRPVADNLCARVSPLGPHNDVLRQGCNEAVRTLLAAGQRPSIEMISVADGAAYWYIGPPTAESTNKGRHPPMPAAMIVEAVLNHYRTAKLDPLEAAREKRVVWLAMPATAMDDSPEMIGASLVAKGTRIYAVVLTRIALKDLLQPERQGLSIPDAIFFDSFGVPLASSGKSVDAQQLDRKLPEREDGVFHWVAGYGWALRLAPLAADFGRLVFVLPPGQQARKMTGELLLVGAIAAAALGLLFAMYRHWNYRFLVVTYEEASRALESEMLNHLLVHVTPVGLCIVRRETLEIIVSNPIAREVLGLAQEDARLPQALRAALAARPDEQNTAVGENGLFQIPLTLNRAGSSPVSLEITYAPAEVRHEAVLFCAIVDVTEHHHSNQLLRQAKLASDAAAKAKLAFFASMSHEIRTPLSSLVGNIELIAMGPLQAEQRERVRAMQVSAEGLMQVVNDVLDFSKIDIGAMSIAEEPGSLVELLEHLATSHAREASKRGLTLHAVFDRHIPAELYFDPVRLSQIVNNLLNNALKFTHSGKIVLRARRGDEGIEIEVSDTGVGIREDERHRLFQPFSQAAPNRLARARGTGLGLSICAKLCELMGGRIVLDSMVGMGTRVTVHLPLKAVNHGNEACKSMGLPRNRTVMLMRASEHYEALLNQFDWGASTPIAMSDLSEPVERETFDCLVVTEEFDPAEVLAWWPTATSIVWLEQQGPLLATTRADGGQDVSVYSRTGIHAALQAAISGAPRLVADATRSADGRASAAPSELLAGLRVLVAEDNPLNRSLLRDQLSMLGAKVLEAGNGHEALAMLANAHVDVVLTDIDMPDMNGFELLREMSRSALPIPVYAVSASTRPEDIAEGRAMGFADYFTKPVPLAVLASALRGKAVTAAEAAHLDESLQAPDPRARSGAHENPEIPQVPAGYARAFLDQTEADIRAYRSAIADQDRTRLERLLHRTSGMLSVLEPSQLLALCEDLRLYLTEIEHWDDETKLQSEFILQSLTQMCRPARADAAHPNRPRSRHVF
ncbi:ATP-binding protein [Paraburkholderia sacchari]|uniref:ATP-binding protein n=1 Tax=Paraburkholderia sacchari TaxID=159450 RepID=UPI001BD0C8DA|nr:ATP-binding protein [Paraburkholderia sacchari]